MRIAVAIGIGISVMVAFNQFAWLGRSPSLAFVLLAIAVVLVIYGAALLTLIKKH
jgi:hypothetical protein